MQLLQGNQSWRWKLLYIHMVYTPGLTKSLSTHHIHGSVRIPIPRERSSRIAAGIDGSSEWRSARHYRNPQWCGKNWIDH